MLNASIKCFGICLCFVLIPQDVCAQTIIHVSPSANSHVTFGDFQKNSKTPVTLTQALTFLKASELRDSYGKPKDNITIQLDVGVYRLSETIKLDALSSGSAEYPVTIQGPKDASAIITGGRAVNDFMPVTDKAVLARLPLISRFHVLQTNLVKQGITDFGKHARHGAHYPNIPTAIELTFRNQPMKLARWPNQGFTEIATTPDGEKGLKFTVQGARIVAWENEPDLFATGYWFQYWADETIPIRILDISSGQFTVSNLRHAYGMKMGQPIFIQNILSELDEPGEWYLDKINGLLYFWPPESPKENEAEVSILEKLLVIDNASNIRINNLAFQSARGDAITVRGGHHVSIANSIIRNIGNHAAVIGGQDTGLNSTLIENIGEGAIFLQGGDRQTLTPANLYAEHNTIRNFARVSRTYQPAVLISGVGNRAIDNKISDSPHNAILFTGNDHLISGNEIFDVCKETGDAGAIYTGRDWTARGTVIFKNHLHDISHNISMGRTKGVYLDDQASGITVSGNVFERVEEAVFIGGGRDNLIENNKFIATTIALHLDARGKTRRYDPNSALRKRLADVPYSQNLYKDRYPHLANILDDEPDMPKYNIARGNQIEDKSMLAIGNDAELGISIEP